MNKARLLLGTVALAVSTSAYGQNAPVTTGAQYLGISVTRYQRAHFLPNRQAGPAVVANPPADFDPLFYLGCALAGCGPDPFSYLLYPDAFGSPTGFHIDVYHDQNRHLRWLFGLATARARGRSSAGGEFPAGVRFSDLKFTALVIGVRAGGKVGRHLFPYALLQVGPARLSAIYADPGSAPYGCGSARRAGTCEGSPIALRANGPFEY